jgi:hypothetical protein
MTIQWADVVARYPPGTTLRPLVGGSTLVVDDIDDQRICVRQRLWRACLTRAELETADDVLATAGQVSPLELAELLRVHYASGPQVRTECSRVPNLSAVLLHDMGVLTVNGPGQSTGAPAHSPADWIGGDA